MRHRLLFRFTIIFLFCAFLFLFLVTFVGGPGARVVMAGKIYDISERMGPVRMALVSHQDGALRGALYVNWKDQENGTRIDLSEGMAVVKEIQNGRPSMVRQVRLGNPLDRLTVKLKPDRIVLYSGFDRIGIIR